MISALAGLLTKGRRLDEAVHATVRRGEGIPGRRTADATSAALVARNTGMAYICSELNARIASTKTIRLYRPAKSAVSLRGYKSRPLTTKQRDRLQESTSLGWKAAERMDSSDDIVEIMDHPLLQLLRRPNYWESGREFTKRRLWLNGLAGQCFTFMEASGSGVDALWLLAPQYTVIQPDPDEFIAAYWYGREPAEAVAFAPEEIIHHRYSPHPSDPYAGASPLMAVLRSVDVEVAVLDTMVEQAINGMRPDYAIEVPEGTTDPQIKATRAELEALYRGPRKQATPWVTRAAKIVPINWTPKDSQQFEALDAMALMVMQSYGVSESILRLNDANLASSQTGHTQYMRNTIAPILASDCDDLNHALVPHYADDGDLWLAYDDPVPADEAARATRNTAMVTAGLMTINEARAEDGYPPIDGGDVLRVNGVSVDSLDASPGLGLFGGTFPTRPQDDEADKPQEPTTVQGPKVEEQALNGAQIAQLVEIARQVSADEITREAGRAIAFAAFPGIPPEKIAEVFAALVVRPNAGEPKPEEPAKSLGFTLAAKSDPWAVHTHVHTKDDDDDLRRVSDVIPQEEMDLIVPVVDEVEAWYNESVPQAFTGGQFDLTPFAGNLAGRLEPLLLAVWTQGALGGLEETGASPDGLDTIVGEYAQEYIREQGTLIAGTATTSTTEAINGAIERGLERGMSIEQIKTEITEALPDVSRNRAEVIARTEVQNAAGAGRERAWIEAGVEGKEWMLSGGACPMCQGFDNYLASKGRTVVKTGEAFAKIGESWSGTDGKQYSVSFRDAMHPPLHPQCRCAILKVEGE